MRLTEFLTKDTWTQGAFARNANGEPTDPSGSDAVSWCIVGAVERCYAATKDNVSAKQKLYSKCKEPTKFNDTSSFNEVMELCESCEI